MAKAANSNLKNANAPMVEQLQKAQKQVSGTGGRKLSTTPSQKAQHSTAYKPTKPRFNPEKNPSVGTGINSKFEDYAPRGYYPTKKGETRVMAPGDSPIYVQPRKLKEKG